MDKILEDCFDKTKEKMKHKIGEYIECNGDGLGVKMKFDGDKFIKDFKSEMKIALRKIKKRLIIVN